MDTHSEPPHGASPAGRRQGGDLATRAARFVAIRALLAAVTVAAIAGVVVWLQFDLIAQDRVEHLADQVRYRFDAEIRAPSFDASLLAGSAIIADAMMDYPYPPYLGVMLDEFMRRKPRMRVIAVHDYWGRMQASSGSADLLAQAAARSGKPRYEWLDNGVLRVAYPIVLPRLGSSEGALLIELDAGAALREVDEASRGFAGYRIILHDISGQRQTWPSSAELASEQLYRTVTRELHVEGFGPIALISVGITAEAYWTPIALLVSILGASIALLVAVVLKTSRAPAGQLVQPIEAMISGIDHLARNPAGDRHPLARSEIVELNTLADAVERMLDAVAVAQQRLDALLTQRTHQLAISEGMLYGILATLDDVVFSCSLDGSKLRYASPSIRHLMDVSGSADINTVWGQLLASVRIPIVVAPKSSNDGRADTIIELRTAAAHGKWVRIKSRIVSGEEHSGMGDRIDGSITDVTRQILAQREHDRVQRQLTEWAQRVDAVFMMSPDGFACFNANGVLVSLNPIMAEILDVGKFDVLGWDEARLLRRLRRRAVSTDAPATDAFRAIAGDSRNGPREAGPAAGAVCWPAQIELVGRRVVRIQVREYHGPIAGRVVYLHDVTQEYEVDRLKSEFLSIAAHELRTPMASLLGYAELLQRHKVAAEATDEVYGIIHRQAERLGRLLDDLLDLARIEARGARYFHFVECQVQGIVHEALDGLAVNGDEREVEVSMPAEPLWVRADPEKLLQALLNVLSNAYKYSARDDRIRLTVSRNSVDGVPIGVFISVVDEGIGMPPDDAEHAFERFFRADRTRSVPGTGLGLSLVKEIIEAHGGSVSLRSQLGQGTELTIVLPLVRAPVIDTDAPWESSGLIAANAPIVPADGGRA